MSNRLKQESSPYLLQHAENPVDWYPWCEEAFRRAKEEDKPVFLSIGYSTCHWCHVMAHESFEDREVADLLNRHFISIKVDKEERPDIDSIYMAVCQAMTGGGGWPTSIFMTPDQKPFFAGTYFPKGGRRGMAGMLEILPVIHEKWQTDRDALLHQAEYITTSLQQSGGTGGTVNPDLPDTAAAIFRQTYDNVYGGFGREPKFPTPHNMLFLLGYYERFGGEDCLEMAETTLTQMYRGGLFDHIGFGFSRYSTDKRFLVPHFEKMLYDNALLMMAYCKAYAVTKKPLYLRIAERTADYVLREMTSPEGGFYSAQDADSEGEEGKYYLFTAREILDLLGKKDGAAFNRHFGISEAGNFEGKNIPNLLGSDCTDASFDRFLPKLAEYRKKRYTLHLDDKILTAWNSLMIAAMCQLYRVSGERVYLEAAQKADGFLQRNLAEGDRLYVSFRGGKRGVPGFLDDYAACLFAQLALHGATLEGRYLERAEQLCSKIQTSFFDHENGGYYLYGRENDALILRPKETYDGAIPSGNSLMAWNLVRLSLVTGQDCYAQSAVRQLDFMAADAARYPVGYAMYLLALLEHENPPPKVTIVTANPEESRVQVPNFSLNVVALLKKPTEEQPLKNGKTTFYVCSDRGCQPPVNELDENVGT